MPVPMLRQKKRFISILPSLGYSSAMGLLALGPVAVMAQPVLSQSDIPTVDITNSSVYPAVFFSQYQAQNALEMIQRLPGFSFDQGTDARGFGGNAGNVLIDGARPTAKSNGLRGALIRIPASQVIRIEILRGGISAGEAAGQSVVANVIRDNSSTSGTWALKGRQVANSGVKPNLEAAISTRLGQWDASFDTDIGASPQYRTALVEQRDAAGALESGADETFSSGGPWAFFNAEGARDLSGGKLTLNGRLGGDNWHADTRRDIYNQQLPDDSVADEFWTLNERNRFRIAELGVDWVKTLDDWKLRLIGLGLTNESNYENDFYNEVLSDGTVSSSHFAQDRRKTELIARATLGGLDGRLKPEYGIEIANNRLDTGLELIEDSVAVQPDNANVEVQEWRGEIFATFVYEASPDLSVEGGITAEFSQIQVSGDSEQRQQFQFIKPRLSSTYHFDDDIRFTLEAEHRVGQLNFNDFATSNSASDDRTTLGNPNLAPNQTTEVAATFDWSFSGRGSIKVKAFHEWRSDILEQVILSTADDGDISQGLGNAGDAMFWGIISELSLPLDWVIPNGLIDLTYRHRRSSFDDSIIGRERSVNNYTPNWLSFEFRQDLVAQQFAWGLEYWGSFTDTNFLVDEIHTLSGNKRLRAFVETTRFFGIKVQLEVTHLNTGRYTRSRFFYQDTRGGAFDGSEVSSRQRRPELKLSLSSSF